MKRSFLFVIIMAIVLFGFTSNSLAAWNFSKPTLSKTPVSAFNSTFASAPTAFSSSTAIAFGCGDCLEATAYTSSFAESGDNWFSSSANAYASTTTIECEDPPCSDIDEDEICDDEDNCVETPNNDQADSDRDGIGNACDKCPDDADNDLDQDGLCAPDDNCPDVSNRDQSDLDDDGTGDVCDACQDVDEDQVCDDVDNCPDYANPNQADDDVDGFGNDCDNCPDHANADQADWDANGVGDICDPTGCDGYLLPECELGLPNMSVFTAGDCTPQYPAVGICPEPECDADDIQCEFDRECPCGAPPPPHGDYVSCITAIANELVDQEIIEPGIGTCYASIAAQSDCGMPQWEEGVSVPPVYEEGECAPLDYSRCFTLEGQVTSVGALTNSTGVFLAAGIRIGTWVTYEICTDENRNGGYFGGPAPASWISQAQYYWADLISFPQAGTVDTFHDKRYGDHSPGKIWVGTFTDNLTITGTVIRPSEWVVGTTRDMDHRKENPTTNQFIDDIHVYATVISIADY